MKIAGSYVIDAPRDDVWTALNDTEVLARTIPGCQRLERVGEHTFETTLNVGLQAVKGIYSGTITLVDIRPPHHYRLLVDGTGSNGFLRGEGEIALTEEPDGRTRISYSGEVSIGGTLATVGQRLIEGAVRTLITQSLKALTVQIQARIRGAANMDSAVVAALVIERNGSKLHADSLLTTIAAPLASPAATAPVRRSVVIHEHKQLKIESLLLGATLNFVKARLWVAWVIIAFLLGWIVGRTTRRMLL